MMLNRRSVLCLLAAGLGGCSQKEPSESKRFAVEYPDQGAFESIEVVASVDGRPATIVVETVVDTSGQQVVLLDGDGGVIGRAVITGGSA